MKMVFAIVNKDDSGVVSEALTQEGGSGDPDHRGAQQEQKRAGFHRLYRHGHLLPLPCGGYGGRRDNLRFARRAVREGLGDICKKAAERLLFYTRLTGQWKPARPAHEAENRFYRRQMLSRALAKVKGDG